MRTPVVDRRVWIAEHGVALGVTLLVLYLHGVNLWHAGGLWRDEAAVVHIAKMPFFSKMWDYVKFDSFPVLSYAALRLWAALGLAETDLAVRMFGCLVGLSVVAALWMSARQMDFDVPLLSLALFGMNPLVIRAGDSLRAYGLGILCVVPCIALLWNVARSPSPRNASLAAVAAVLSVQCLYQNAFLLTAIGVAAMAVAFRNGQWKGLASVAGICGAAGLSLVPYLGVWRQVWGWRAVHQIPAELREEWKRAAWQQLTQALGVSGSLTFYVWVGLLLAVFAAVACCALRSDEEFGRKDFALYSLIVVGTGPPLYYVFLKTMNITVQGWHYLPLMAVLAVCLDAMVVRCFHAGRARQIRIGLTLAVAAGNFLPSLRALHTRQTNIDVVARRLEETASKGDWILVNPWYCGATFQRYYRGQTPWSSVPPLLDHTVHRSDLLKQHLSSPDALGPVWERMKQTLAGGHRVWIVGGMTFVREGESPQRLPPAPQAPQGWYSNPYLASWSAQLGHYVQTRARRVVVLPPVVEGQVNPLENAAVIRVEGWR